MTRPSLSFGYQAMDWNSNADYQADYTKLMQLYRNSPALQNGEIKLYQTSKAICSYRISSTEKDTGTDKYQWQSGKIESAYGAGRG